jgi:hypothetical protein
MDQVEKEPCSDLRCRREAVKALSSIRDTLNSELPLEARALFHAGEVGIFDVEHILCKLASVSGLGNNQKRPRLA